MRGRVYAVASIAAVAIASTGCNATSPFAAIVNGTRISQASLLKEVKGLAANQAFVTAYNQAQQQGQRAGITSTNTASPEYSQGFVAAVLGIEIQAAVVHTAVLQRKIEPPASSIDDPATVSAAGQQFGADVFAKFSPYIRHLWQVRQVEQDALGKSLPNAGPTDADVQQFYDANQQDFISTQCVSHLLVATQAAAQAAAGRIHSTADFNAVAAQVSTDKTVDLGCGPLGSGADPIAQDQAFQQAAAGAVVGAVTGPVQVTNGWDVLIVTKRTLQPLDDTLKAQIKAQLQQQQPSGLSGFFQQAAKTLKVEVNPIYGHWDSTQLQIVAPNAPDPVKSGLPSPASSPATSNTPAVQPGAPAGQPGAPTDQNGAPTDQTGAPTDQTGQPPVPTDQTGAPTDQTGQPGTASGQPGTATGQPAPAPTTPGP